MAQSRPQAAPKPPPRPRAKAAASGRLVLPSASLPTTLVGTRSPDPNASGVAPLPHPPTHNAEAGETGRPGRWAGPCPGAASVPDAISCHAT